MIYVLIWLSNGLSLGIRYKSATYNMIHSITHTKFKHILSEIFTKHQPKRAIIEAEINSGKMLRIIFNGLCFII